MLKAEIKKLLGANILSLSQKWSWKQQELQLIKFRLKSQIKTRDMFVVTVILYVQLNVSFSFRNEWQSMFIVTSNEQRTLVLSVTLYFLYFMFLFN